MRLLKTIVTFLPLLVAASFTAQAAIIDSINPDGLPQQADDNAWNVENVGWVYTPTFNYTLLGVNTLFGPDTRSALPQTVTLEVFDEVGGVLLRSVDFMAAANTWSGGLFADLMLLAGEDYFIGFRNVTDLQANYNEDGIAPTSLPFFYNFSGDPDYSQSLGGSFTQALLQFEGVGTAPAPATLGLLGIGFLGLRLAKRKRA